MRFELGEGERRVLTRYVEVLTEPAELRSSKGRAKLIVTNRRVVLVRTANVIGNGLAAGLVWIAKAIDAASSKQMLISLPLEAIVRLDAHYTGRTSVFSIAKGPVLAVVNRVEDLVPHVLKARSEAGLEPPTSSSDTGFVIGSATRPFCARQNYKASIVPRWCRLAFTAAVCSIPLLMVALLAKEAIFDKMS
jgi:hypothetical protein